MTGRTTARGYDGNHRRLRRQWATLVDTGTVLCWRCGLPIPPGTPWDLGHDDHDRSITRGPEHANQCNRAAAGRHPAKKRRPTEPHPGLVSRPTPPTPHPPNSGDRSV